MAEKEWARSGSFIKKPATGWLHDDAALTHGDGVYYPVKYVGCIPMEKSMRDLRFEDRTAVTREAITLCCEAAGLRPPRKRKVTKVIKDCLVADPVTKNLNVKLTISTTGIALVVIETNQVIANHIMPNISFATGGDAEDYDVIGYVAKDARNARECHVFDCGHMAHDVMATVGQAFELRFKAFLKKGAQRDAMGGGGATYDEAGFSGGDRLYDDLPEGGTGYGATGYGDTGLYGDAGAYGGVVIGGGAPAPREGLYDAVGMHAGLGGAPGAGVYGDHAIYDNKPGVLGGAPAAGRGGAGAYGDVVYDSAGAIRDAAVNPLFHDAVYDNAAGVAGDPDADYDEDFAMDGAALMKAPNASELERPLSEEGWFHGQLQRSTADRLLTQNGDFLVRESIQSRGQYVLSAMQQGQPKHLLLVDPAGRVRTKDMTFDSVSHLINYHIRARIPIISRGSRIVLGEPVPRRVGSDAYEALPRR